MVTDKFIEPSPRSIEVEMFKNQNVGLFDQFLRNVKTSDIVVADLSHNNPNVHVELGLAISFNKNILRVSSRNIVEVGSDVKGYEVNRYENAADLTKIVLGYLKTFLLIRDMPFDETAGHLYSDAPIRKSTFDERDLEPVGAMRDGACRVRFSFLPPEASDEWFGIFLRCDVVHPWSSGYLLYIRQNGWLELAELPNVNKLKTERVKSLELNREYILEVEIDGEHIAARLGDDGAQFDVDELSNQSFGNIVIGTNKCQAMVQKVEIVCRDTIAFAR